MADRPDDVARDGSNGDGGAGRSLVPSGQGPGAVPGEGTFASLRYRNYRLLWLGQSSHAAALWMEQIARPWLVLEITNDNPVHLGGVIAVRTVPQLLFGVWAGVLADWFDRKTILLGTKIGVLILNVVFAALLITGTLELWHVYAAALIRGTFMSFDQPARQSLIGSIVPTRLITNATALMSATQNTMRILGAAGSGFFIAFAGLDATFVTIAVIYSGAVLATMLLDVPSHRPAGRRGGLKEMALSLREGASYAMRQPSIRGVLLLSLIYFSFGMSWMQVFAPLFAKTVMEIGSGGLGALMSTSGAGALLGTLFIATRKPVRVGLILPVVVSAMGGILILFSLSTFLVGVLGLLVPFVIVAGTGALQTAYMSLSNATLITAAPEAMRGRVISLLSLDRAMVTLGASLGGFVAAAAGVQAAQILYGSLVLVFGLAMLVLGKGLRDYRIAESETPTERPTAELRSRETVSPGPRA